MPREVAVSPALKAGLRHEGTGEPVRAWGFPPQMFHLGKDDRCFNRGNQSNALSPQDRTDSPIANFGGLPPLR
ncbi:hypothetical protein [Tolypothrix bouteillei]|uniref:hypothetical protein n=1 Tax=Tolypothrix bouteillei TaxID=1246981 RepID=UPI000679021E|nr:hypothetical protein [Tolypothrix bouteillei]